MRAYQAVEDKTKIVVPLWLQLATKDELLTSWRRRRTLFNNPIAVLYPDPTRTTREEVLQARELWFVELSMGSGEAHAS